VVKDIKEEPIKAVLYYINQREYANEEFMASIRAECAEYKNQKYQPAIFISGNEDLKETLYWLLKHNLKVLAEHPERFGYDRNYNKIK